MRGTAVALCSILFLLVMPGSPAARQLAASEAPSVSGPLTVTEEGCERQNKKRRGRVVARLRSCLWVYRHANDNDPPRDHGSFWLQVTVKPVDGWCATEVVASTEVPSTTSIGDSRTPRRVTRPSGRREMRARVVIDAEGAAPTVGTIKQHFYLYPRVLRRSGVSETSDGHRRMSITWKGSSGNKLAFVVGAELSYAYDRRPTVTRDIDYTIIRSRSC